MKFYSKKYMKSINGSKKAVKIAYFMSLLSQKTHNCFVNQQKISQKFGMKGSK